MAAMQPAEVPDDLAPSIRSDTDTGRLRRRCRQCRQARRARRADPTSTISAGRDPLDHEQLRSPVHTSMRWTPSPGSHRLHLVEPQRRVRQPADELTLGRRQAGGPSSRKMSATVPESSASQSNRNQELYLMVASSESRIHRSRESTSRGSGCPRTAPRRWRDRCRRQDGTQRSAAWPSAESRVLPATTALDRVSPFPQHSRISGRCRTGRADYDRIAGHLAPSYTAEPGGWVPETIARRAMASATRTTCTISRTACTRTMCAPINTLAATAAAVAQSRSPAARRRARP